MIWFDIKPQRVKAPKKFIVDVLRRFARAEPGDGGMQLGRYIAGIDDVNVAVNFYSVILKLIENRKTEPWIKEELKVAISEKRDLRSENLADFLKEAELLVKEAEDLLSQQMSKIALMPESKDARKIHMERLRSLRKKLGTYQSRLRNEVSNCSTD